jgi:DNA-binding transcriptional regulator PaaX
MAGYIKNTLAAYRMLKHLFSLRQADDKFIVSINEEEEYGGDAAAKRRFRYLQQAGYLKRIDDDLYQLTDLAKVNLLREIMATREVDEKSRLMLFDIPERLKQHRDMLRIQLKQAGFRMLQRSVWVADKPCEDLVWLLAKHHGVSRYAMLMVGEILTPKTAIAGNRVKKKKARTN